MAKKPSTPNKPDDLGPPPQLDKTPEDRPARELTDRERDQKELRAMLKRWGDAMRKLEPDEACQLMRATLRRFEQDPKFRKA